MYRRVYKSIETRQSFYNRQGRRVRIPSKQSVNLPYSQSCIRLPATLWQNCTIENERIAKIKHRLLPGIGFCQLKYKRIFSVGRFIIYYNIDRTLLAPSLVKKPCFIRVYIITKSMRALLIGQSAMVYCAGKLMKKSRVRWINI